MPAHRLPDPVASVLDRVEQHSRSVRLAVIGAAMVEGLLLVLSLALVDWGNSVHVLLFLFSVLTYTVVALGLLALGAHVSRVGARVVAALDARG
ncbi:MAG: hypothetical protein WD801_16910 [Gemmatimonadaceae bacterium]